MANTKKPNILVLASGRGSNFSAVVQHNHQKHLFILQHLITERENATCIQIAQAANIPHLLINRKSFNTRQKFDETIAKKIQEFSPDLILTLGFLHILPTVICSMFRNRIINIHPSLLPAFPGLNAQRQAWDYGVKVSGATTHFVTKELDKGPIIHQTTVPRLPNDSFSDFSGRILKAEHSLIVRTVTDFCDNKIVLYHKKK